MLTIVDYPGQLTLIFMLLYLYLKCFMNMKNTTRKSAMLTKDFYC